MTSAGAGECKPEVADRDDRMTSDLTALAGKSCCSARRQEGRNVCDGLVKAAADSNLPHRGLEPTTACFVAAGETYCFGRRTCYSPMDVLACYWLGGFHHGLSRKWLDGAVNLVISLPPCHSLV